MDKVKENPKIILEIIKNLHKALEIAQKNGAYTLQQAFATYENLQRLDDYIKISLPLISKLTQLLPSKPIFIDNSCFPSSTMISRSCPVLITSPILRPSKIILHGALSKIHPFTRLILIFGTITATPFAFSDLI